MDRLVARRPPGAGLDPAPGTVAQARCRTGHCRGRVRFRDLRRHDAERALRPRYRHRHHPAQCRSRPAAAARHRRRATPGGALGRAAARLGRLTPADAAGRHVQSGGRRAGDPGRRLLGAFLHAGRRGVVQRACQDRARRIGRGRPGLPRRARRQRPRARDRHGARHRPGGPRRDRRPVAPQPLPGDPGGTARAGRGDRLPPRRPYPGPDQPQLFAGARSRARGPSRACRGGRGRDGDERGRRPRARADPARRKPGDLPLRRPAGRSGGHRPHGEGRAGGRRVPGAGGQAHGPPDRLRARLRHRRPAAPVRRDLVRPDVLLPTGPAGQLPGGRGRAGEGGRPDSARAGDQQQRRTRRAEPGLQPHDRPARHPAARADRGESPDRRATAFHRVCALGRQRRRSGSRCGRPRRVAQPARAGAARCRA